jgi:NAD(P)-dependent dehydrogenase (short-subunit alcohol dehydrogenase family)
MRDTSKWETSSNRDNIVVSQLDVSNDESVNVLVSKIIEEEGQIDIIVNNAGYGIAGCVECVTIEEAKAMFDVNLWGVVRVLQAALPVMRSRRRGHIINISSTIGIRGIPAFEYYCSSKFALEGLADSMRYSLAPYGISVTNVNAGPVKTPFGDKFGSLEKGGLGTRDVDDPDNFLVRLTKRMAASLARRMKTPEAKTSEEVAMVVANVAQLKHDLSNLHDVPFNVGSSPESQAILEEFRKHPTGWGGTFTTMLKAMPKLGPKKHEEL